MNIYFVGSFDPPHNGHLNTYKKACTILNAQIGIAICANELKSAPLLSLEERKQLCRVVFETDDIVVCRNISEVKQFAKKCDIFVRGYRDQSDEQYTRTLVDYYDLEISLENIKYVHIDDSYLDVSSSKIKSLLSGGCSIQRYLPNAVYKYLSEILCNYGT